MSQTGPEPWPLILLFGAVVLVLVMAWRGWRLGIVRQALSIVALGLGYVAGYFGGRFLVPVLRPLGFPDWILAVVGAVVVGFVVYAGLAISSGVIFKRTGHQSVGVVRWGFGLSGAALGAVFGLFLVLVSMVALRLIGSVADGEARGQASAPAAERRAVSRLAAVKRSIEESPAAALVEQVDPVPEKVYATLSKVGQVAGNAQNMERFANDRQVQHVSAHPKILALRDDPEIATAVRSGDFITLLRNPKIVAAANDPEVAKLLGNFDLLKALDGAIKPTPRPLGR